MRRTSPRWSISRPPANISPTATRDPTRLRSGLGRSGRARSAQARSARPIMAKGRILLVEDDRALVELLVYHFEREDFEVRATADGEEALLSAREAAPDVVI